jgi:LysR family transcriptional regulator, nitrogen assimilation regulatory protein
VEIDLKSLRAFCSVAEHGSFSRAAAVQSVAQSILSRQIAALEAELGGKLFHRTGRGVLPTELGVQLLPRAMALLSDSQAFQDAAVGLRMNPSGVVTLGMVPIAARSFVGPLSAKMQQAYPRIRLSVMEGYTGQVEEWLASGRVDIALFNRVRSGKVRDAEPVIRTELFLLGARKNPAVRRPEIAFRELAGVPLVLPSQPNSITSYYMSVATSQHFELNIVLEAGSTAMFKDAILQAGLCAINPRQIVARELDAGEIRASRIVKPTIIQTTWLALGSQRPLSEAARLVSRLLLDLAKSS